MGLAAGIGRTEAGKVRIERTGLLAAGEDVRRRLVIAALRWVAGAGYAPRADAVQRLLDAIAAGKSATLAGCAIRCGTADIRVAREPKAFAGVETGTRDLWDNRWRLAGPPDPALRVQVLGPEGLLQVKAWLATGLSRATLIVTPAIWRGDRLVAAPLAGLSNGWVAEIVAAFPGDVLSH